jgi:uncharacterized protein YbbC (DUF1343 family)
MLRTGAEVAARNGWPLLHGKRVGVLCNPSALVRSEKAPYPQLHLVDVLRQGGVDVVRLYGPEHGIWSTAQDLIAVDGGRDPVFGLDVTTLYGRDESTLHVTPGALDGIDVLVVDVQDVGARYYTYAATLCFALAACGAAGVDVVVLDRPNPLGGEVIEGGAVDPAYRSFVGFFDLPQRHGLTLAEIARLYAAEQQLGTGLHVVACEHWHTAGYFDEQPWGRAGSPWYAPSPNMPAVATAVVYPGLCLVEGTRLSEGRGTTRPFELVGAPWLDARAFAECIASEAQPGLHVRPLRFEPTFQKFAGEVCGGVAVEVTDRQAFQPVRAGLAILRAALQLGGERFHWRTETYEFVSDRLAFDLLMGGPEARALLMAGAIVDDVCAGFSVAEQAFAERARPHLLYGRGAGLLAGACAAAPMQGQL